VIVQNGDNQFLLEGDCDGLETMEAADSLGLIMLPSTLNKDTVFIDPRPKPNSILFQNVEDVSSINNDAFFDKVDFRGAFGTDLWIADFSLLTETGQIPKNVYGSIHSGPITDSETLTAGVHLLTAQVAF
jgi:hypothetical protein